MIHSETTTHKSVTVSAECRSRAIRRNVEARCVCPTALTADAKLSAKWHYLE
jgi:hypothetical protein